MRPFRCSEALAWLVMVCVAGAAGVFTAAMAGDPAGIARVASAVSAATPERGRNVKVLILDRIYHPFIYWLARTYHTCEISVTCSGDFLICL